MILKPSDFRILPFFMDHVTNVTESVMRVTIYEDIYIISSTDTMFLSSVQMSNQNFGTYYFLPDLLRDALFKFEFPNNSYTEENLYDVAITNFLLYNYIIETKKYQEQILK